MPIIVLCVCLEGGNLVCPSGRLVSLLQMSRLASAVPLTGIFNVHHTVVMHDRTLVRCSSRSKRVGAEVKPRVPEFCSAIGFVPCAPRWSAHTRAPFPSPLKGIQIALSANHFHSCFDKQIFPIFSIPNSENEFNINRKHETLIITVP